jgi:hypothetical protein
MNSENSTSPMNSFHVMRVVRRYEREFGSRVLRYLEEQVSEGGGVDLRWEDIQAAVGKAYADFHLSPRPSAKTMAASMADIAAGRTKPIQDVIDGLRCSTD